MKILKKIVVISLLTSCANMIAPSGGSKDISPPHILNSVIMADTKQPRHKTIIFEFNEYVQLNKWDTYFYISPPTSKPTKKKIKGKKLVLHIEDTLLQNTTYYVSLNSCIKDNNEGNVLDTLEYKFSTDVNFDTLTIMGSLNDSYTLNPIQNAWVMIFNAYLNDSLIFNKTPNYIAKTDENGFFHFPNLQARDYKIAALTGIDFMYNEEEKMAFLDRFINPKIDSFISFFAFDPVIKVDSFMIEPSPLKKDSITSILNLDTVGTKAQLPLGKLKINLNQDIACIFQLLQNEKLIKETCFIEEPYIIEGIDPGEYQLKYIIDNNQDSIWNTGSWDNRMQPEKVINYPSNIIIRSNWDLELEWIIE